MPSGLLLLERGAGAANQALSPGFIGIESHHRPIHVFCALGIAGHQGVGGIEALRDDFELLGGDFFVLFLQFFELPLSQRQAEGGRFGVVAPAAVEIDDRLKFPAHNSLSISR